GNTLGKRERRRAHSPFALALMKGLRGAADRIYSDRGRATLGDGVITATDLYLYIRNTIEHAPFRQIPGLWPMAKHRGGEFIFLVPGHARALPSAPLLDRNNNPYRGLDSYEEE